jgi:hypothetical protein
LDKIRRAAASEKNAQHEEKDLERIHKKIHLENERKREKDNMKARLKEEGQVVDEMDEDITIGRFDDTIVGDETIEGGGDYTQDWDNSSMLYQDDEEGSGNQNRYFGPA